MVKPGSYRGEMGAHLKMSSICNIANRKVEQYVNTH